MERSLDSSPLTDHCGGIDGPLENCYHDIEEEGPYGSWPEMLPDFNFLDLNKRRRPGKAFEDFVRLLLDVFGCLEVEYTGSDPAHEAGADFLATRDTELFPGRVVPVKWAIQCKCVADPTRHFMKLEEQLYGIVRQRKRRHVLLILAVDPPAKFRQSVESWADTKGATVEVWGKTELLLFVAQHPRLYHWLYEQPATSDSVDDLYSHRFYHLGTHFARALRLVGAAEEFFPPNCVRTTQRQQPYRLPAAFQHERTSIISKMKKEAKRTGAVFFNGVHTRLIDYDLDADPSTEQKSVVLHLGPIRWFDYAVANESFWSFISSASPKKLKPYVNLEEVAHSGNISTVQLSNIVCSAVSVVTADGYIIYSQRSRRVSGFQGQLTCAVAENMQAEKDRSLVADQPGDLPAPFRTAIRGISEELSPRLAKALDPQALFFLGICFDLQSMHPDFLFAWITDLTLEQFLSTCRNYPGKDFVEGTLHWVTAARNGVKLSAVLAEDNWVPTGKASFIRAIEFVDCWRELSGLERSEVLTCLAAGRLPELLDGAFR